MVWHLFFLLHLLAGDGKMWNRMREEEMVAAVRKEVMK